MKLKYVIMLEKVDGGIMWVAHCLEHNVCSHGQTLLEAYENLMVVARGYEELTSLDSVSTFSPAPASAILAYMEARRLGNFITSKEYLAYNKVNHPWYGELTLNFWG